MATTDVKRHDNAVIPSVTITNSDGTKYDLTNHTVKFIMWFEDVLKAQLVAFATDVTVKLTTANVDMVEANDILLVDHERMLVTGVPTQPLATTDAEFTVTRANDIAAESGFIFGSKDVAGTGATIYELSANATFDLSIDGGAAVTTTVTSASTVGNTTMAHLVTDVNTAIAGAATASSNFDRLKISSNATGTNSSIVITNPNSIATDELGLVAATGTGTDGVTIAVAAHNTNSVVKVIKVEADGEVASPATDGKAIYQWASGETAKVGTYMMEFEIKNPNGKKETHPDDKSHTVTIVEDANDVNL